MFFSGKLNLQIKELQAEVAELRANNDRLINENQELTRRCYEQENVQTNNDADDQREVCAAWVKGGELVSQVRETIATAAQNLEQEKDSLNNSMSIFDETKEAVETILDRVHVIQANAQDGNNHVKGLITVSEQIEKFVGVIRDISDQTNLLALNAAIEAARAGESGRGFAVVADEVRNLARKASEASDEIASLVGQISSQTAIASDDIGQVDILSSEVVASAEQIKAGVKSVVELSGRMNTIISASAADTFIETVKLDHVNWKNKVYEGIVSGQFDGMTSLADHTSCRLGNWYYMGAGRERYSSCSSFQSLEAPHERVHTSGLAAVDAARTGDVKTAAMHLSAMEKASMEVADALDRLNAEMR
ncbi:methyl-accepting chemotaxis protein [Neptuniibacter sp.]|uniref:methyl-accepting chemotaxis protein n=1 Tax=Neptuniibacter sp. TaxID=1962643 RepID=UPI0026140AB0|nr:methyl-accepting chemotaxis protein [Neptuniibacter sp.]MCP4596106.1 chemotaxis protein [Neptuniibacter sp.]